MFFCRSALRACLKVKVVQRTANKINCFILDAAYGICHLEEVFFFNAACQLLSIKRSHQKRRCYFLL